MMNENDSIITLLFRMAVLCGLCGLAPSGLQAAGGNVASLPTNFRKARAGLDLTIDTRGVSGNGYRPVTIEFKNRPAIPAVADRTLEVFLRPNDNDSSFSAPDMTVSVTVEIAEGSLGSKITMPVPQSQYWASLGVEVFEGGRNWKELSNIVGIGGGGGYSEAIPVILIIDSAAPLRDQRLTAQNQKGIAQSNELSDVSVLFGILPNSTGANYYAPQVAGGPANTGLSTGNGDLSTLQNLQRIESFELLQPDELPERWLEYSAYDMIFISLDELSGLIADYPKKWPALRAWAASGPTLCVMGLGDDFDKLAQLERFLELSPSDDAQSGISGNGPWTVPTKRQFAPEIKSLTNLNQWRGNWNAAANNPNATPVPKQELPEKPIFAMRANGLGTVVAFASQDAFPGDEHQWGCLFNTLPTRNWMWYQRHGVSLRRLNRDYWKFLILGVGLAPVKSFLVLISLFALVIGPVNYMVLRRWRRMYLLLVTVPIAAVVVTTCLFAWAILGDGLGSRVRIRSFTHIEQASGRTVSWSRHSYYAGMVPSNGLTFPADAVVYPIEHIPKPGSRRLASRELRWTTDGDQNYRNGYMTSRVTSQLLVGRSRVASWRIELAGADNGNPARIVNKLGTRINHLLLRDGAGNYFWGQEVADAGEAALETVIVETATSRWRDLTLEHDPIFPPGYNELNSEIAFGRVSAHYFGWTIDHQAPEPSAETGLLEVALDHIIRGANVELENGSYLAIVERPPEVPLGIEQASEEASFHVIRGTLGIATNDK